MNSPLGLFVAGTNTEVGKTYVAAMIARGLTAAGVRVGVYKPAASGCRQVAAELIADDAVSLWEAAGKPLSLDQVCPQRFLPPLAPPRAALEDGRRVDQQLLRAGVEPWRTASDFLLVEGAGGLMSPLSDDDYNIDLARDLKLPLLIVAANELGVINAALQTLITARTQAAGLPVAGIVLNQVQQNDSDVSLGSNEEELAARSEVPVLSATQFGATQFEPAVDWLAVAAGC